MNILLVEDDPMIGDSVQRALQREGMQVTWLTRGETVEATLRSSPFNALLLDLTLPRRDGMDIIRGIRAAKIMIPVLVITARDNISDRIVGLNLGADDYLIKPFDLDELIARLRALVRRASGRPDNHYRRADICVNCDTHEASIANEAITLSAREWSILEVLISRPGAVHSRAKLEQHLYGGIGDVESNVVEVYIHGLRRKLGTDFIINIRGIGYMVAKSE